MAQTAVDIVVKVVGDQKLKQLDTQLKGTAASSVKASAGLDKAAKSASNLGAKSKAATSGVTALASKLAVAAAAFVTLQKAAELAGNAIRESVARTTAEAQLSILAKQFGEVDQALALAGRSASKFGLGLTETTGQITQVYARLRPLGATIEEIETVFNGFNTAARLGGSTAAEASGAFLQLSQALGSGYLRGQEFNSVAEQAPMVLQAIAAETGLAVGALKEFAAEGGITSDVVLRALKRIETEGAGQLAEALDTPQQAFKDLQNATEDFNVALGNLLQPAVLAFIKELTSALEFLTGALNGVKVIIDALIGVLQPLINLAQSAAAAFDNLGISFNGFVNEVLKSLPGIGQAIRALELLNQLSGGKFGGGGESGGIEIPKPSTGGGLASQFSAAPIASSGGSGRGGGGSAAADAAARAAEQEERRLKAAQEALLATEAKLAIEQALNPVIEAQLQSQEQIRQINAEYTDKIAEATSEETKKVLEQARGVELQLEGVKLEKELADLRESAVGSIQDEIEMLQARLNGTEEVLAAEREIAALKAQGISGGEATALVNTKKQLEEQVKAQDAARASAEQLAGSIASSLTSSLRGLIDGSMSAEEALANAFQSIADAFLDMAMQMIQQWIQMQLMGLVGSFFGGGSGGFGVTPLTSGMSFFADGGRPPLGEVSVVGERGPELFVPSSPGTIVSNEQSRAQLDMYSPGNAVDAPAGPMNVNMNYSGPTMAFDDKRYLPVEAVPAIIKDAAKQGEQRALSSMRNRVSTRNRVGI